MKPGRELDALVAEKVFGWRREQRKRWAAQDPTPFFVDVWVDDTGRERSELPNFSEAIAAAWEVLEHIRSDYERFSYGIFVEPAGTAHVEIVHADGVEKGYFDANSVESVAHAACLAALKCVGALK